MKKIITNITLLALVLCSCNTNATEIKNTPVREDVAVTETAEAEWKIEGNSLTSPIGEHFSLPEIPEWEEYEIISYWPKPEYRCLIKYQSYGKLDLYVADTLEGQLTLLTEGQTALDYTVAYDTVYWYNLDRTVWASSWTEDYTARLFCEDAVAVSPFTDECEGAIVEPGRENINYGYNGLPIYSPYGLVD